MDMGRLDKGVGICPKFGRYIVNILPSYLLPHILVGIIMFWPSTVNKTQTPDFQFVYVNWLVI